MNNPDAPHYVYRGYDELGLLLYVGCTANVSRRLAQHRARGVWTENLVRVETEGPFDRAHARSIEAAAIVAEKPYYNAHPEHTASLQANRIAASKLLDGLLLDLPKRPTAKWSQAWYIARDAISVMIRHAYPVVDQEVRTQWYLAAREARMTARIHAP